jgi:hypothetical protein
LKRFSFFDRLFHSREASVEMCEYDSHSNGEVAAERPEGS